VARRISIHRATTVGPNTGLCQVIIKNTNAFKESSSTAHINRSQSLLTTNRIPIIASTRGERIRLESLLADVWTRDILPYPGMSGRARSEHLVRASASSMMRKLSVASIASNFTKRSGSVTSLQRTTDDDFNNDHETIRTRTSSPNQPDHSSSEAGTRQDSDDPTGSRLSIIQDEKENIRSGSFDAITGVRSASNDSPASTLRRMATASVKKGLGHDVHRIITPPVRTSSANSFGQSLHRTVTMPNVPDMLVEEKEAAQQGNASPLAQSIHKSGKKVKVFKSSRMVPEGIRSFFR
jgi:hypothetical protein